MMILNMTIARFMQSHLLANEHFNDRAELIKYILPWGDIYNEDPYVFDITVRIEKFVNDYYKYSCDSSCTDIDKCVENYPELTKINGQETAEIFHLYNPIACEIGRTYDSCAKNGYYDYNSDDSSRKWSNIDKNDAYSKIYDLVTRMPFTYDALLVSCVAKGLCENTQKIDPLFDTFTHHLPKDTTIAKILGDAVCDPSCVPIPCSNDISDLCIPDRCYITRDDWKFFSIYNPYVCKVTKSWLECNKSPELESSGLNAGAIVGIVVGVLAFIAIVVVIPYYIATKCKKNEKTDEEP